MSTEAREDEWKPTGRPCRKCGKEPVLYREVEDDEGHEDYEYRCQNPKCKHHWWVDGLDS